MLNFLQLLHDHKDELLVLLSLGAVCVSLLTALLAPIIQIRVARLNASASVLVANRVKWIEGVQTDIATLAALVERTEFLQKSMVELKKQFPKMSKDQSDEFTRLHREYEEKTFQRNTFSTLIGIKLDISSDKRARLFTAIVELATQTPGLSTDAPALVLAQAKVQKIAQEILDEEWYWVERQIGRSRRKL